LKYSFTYRHLREQIGLQGSSTNTIYSHVPTSDSYVQDCQAEDTLHDEQQRFSLEMTDTQLNHHSDEYQQDPFCIDEKQPIFNGDRTATIKI
ncbi:unnamed protein product, partial [Adineta ricciae]